MARPDDDTLLLQLYEDAAAGQGAGRALHGLTAGLGARVGHLLATDGDTGAPLWGELADRSGGAYASGADDYVHHHWRTDPRRRGMTLLRPGSAWTCERIVDEREVARSEFFQTFFLPLELRWTMVGRLPTAGPSGRESVDLAIVRAPGEGAFTTAERERLQRWLPHLGQALRVQRRVREAEALGDALQAQGAGLVTLDARLRVVSGRRGDAAAIGSALTGRQRACAPALAMAAAATLKDGRPRHVELLADSGNGLEPLWVALHRRISADGAVELPLLLSWPGRRPTPSAGALAELFGLSQREAELACALLDGRTPREIWTERGVAAATVRSQLRSLFAKTGTRSQLELVRRLGRLA